MRFRCAHCKSTADRPSGHVNRARAKGMKLFCSRRCFGLDRRKNKTPAQKREEKRLYDIEYRAKNHDLLKTKKHEYFKRTYDPEKAAIERKKRMPLHVEYCRRPEYKAWKRDYDREYRAKEYGAFAEAYQLTIDLNREIKERTSRHEIKYQNGATNKAQRRRRQGQQEERGRNAAGRRSGYPATHGW